MPTDVLLINSNRMRPPIAPLALEYLALALDRAGLTSAVCDLCLADDPAQTLTGALADHDAHLIAVTMRNADDCYCAGQHSFIPDLQALVGQIRAQSDAPVVLGGAGYSTAAEAITELVGADYGVVGDGEEALPRLAVALQRGLPLAEIPGLVWQEHGVWRRNPPVFGSFGQEPLPRDRLDNARYFREGGQGGLETKRGCPMACTYCADPLSKGRHCRLRPPQAIVAEARRLLDQGVDALHLCDSEFNVPLEHAKAVCTAFIAAGLSERLRWWAYLSPVPFDDELAGLLVRAGCAGVNFGADSGDAEMLRRLGRAHTPDGLRETARLCRRHDLTFMFDLLLAAPGETRASLRRTIELAQEVDADCVGVALGLRLYAGTPAAEWVQQQGLGPDHPSLRGRIAGNPQLAWPIFYLEAGLGEDVVGYLKELIGADRSFFFSWPDDSLQDYNYDDNPALVHAIAGGARGAYWDILRRLSG